MVVVVLDIDQRIVGDGDDALTWVAVDITKGTYLPHKEIPQSGELVEYAVGCIVNALVAADETSVEAPFATTGIHLSTANQDLQFPFIETEDDAVY